MKGFVSEKYNALKVKMKSFESEKL